MTYSVLAALILILLILIYVGILWSGRDVPWVRALVLICIFSIDISVDTKMTTAGAVVFALFLFFIWWSSKVYLTFVSHTATGRRRQSENQKPDSGHK